VRERPRRTRLAVVLALSALILAGIAMGCGGRAAAPGPSPSGGSAPSRQSPDAAASPPASTSLPPGSTSPHPAVVHIVVIVMENKPASGIIGNPGAPFINQLAESYSLAAGYSALFHPSLPNYIALTSGSNQGIVDDRSPPTAGYAVDATNLADRIEASGRTWKLYAESIPSPGYASGDTHLYATRHVPFLYYKDILDNAPRRARHIVPFSRLQSDFRSASSTPDFAFITPNLCNDMHDCSVAVGDSWLRRWVPVILGSPSFTSSPSLLIVTWDEGAGSDQRVATILAGSAARRHYTSTRAYDHYSLLHTIEAAWQLQPLTNNDARATTMDEFLH
jgi:hypothetical protein